MPRLQQQSLTTTNITMTLMTYQQLLVGRISPRPSRRHQLRSVLKMTDQEWSHCYSLLGLSSAHKPTNINFICQSTVYSRLGLSSIHKPTNINFICQSTVYSLLGLSSTHKPTNINFICQSTVFTNTTSTRHK